MKSIHWCDVVIYRTEVGFVFNTPIDQFNVILKKFGQEEEKDCDGCCVTLKANNGHVKYLVYVENRGDFESLAHEIYHCTNRILTDRGALQDATDDEQGAYLCGYLTSLAMKWFK